MNFDINELFKTKEYNDEKKKYFSNFSIVDVIYHKTNDSSIIKANNDCLLPYSLYSDLLSYLDSVGVKNAKLFIKANNQDLPLQEISLYLQDYLKENDSFKDCVPIISEEGFSLLYNNKDSYTNDLSFLDELKLYFYDLGYRKNINMIFKQIESHELEERMPLPKTYNQNEFNDKKVYDRSKYNRKKEYIEVKIDDLIDTLYTVKFRGVIFKTEEKEVKTGFLIKTLYVKDEDNAVIVKLIENKKFPRQMLDEYNEGVAAEFYGNYRLDSFLNDYVFEPDQIIKIDNFLSLHDDAKTKRVELHAHTKFSEMDGVSSPEEIVNAAYDMGHRGVAITDHLCLQGFHKAWSACKSIKKKNPDADFKVLYGCEMNVVAPKLSIVYNGNDSSLVDLEYVVFDLETTGLSTRYDHIIEFGAVIMKRGMEIKRVDILIKPPVALSTFTKNLTHITEDDLKNAKSFAEVKDEILDLIKGRVLVAHNASFDYGFLNAELNRLGLPALDNPVIDSLDLSKNLLKSRRAYRLGNVCRAYNVEYDEEVAHRADYDASVLASVFNLMLKDSMNNGVITLNDLQNNQAENSFTKNRVYHVNLLSKNKKGLKELYKLVSISNTETLAVFDKVSAKDNGQDKDQELISTPMMFKQIINQHRNDILVGSSCLNSELFEIASTRSKEELAKEISFYDYIEIQPIENYRPVYEYRDTCTKDRLIQYLKDIISEAKKQNKIIVATGDVHFVAKDEKILRDVYINAKGIGGIRHPLYIYDKTKRANQITPDQRFLNTNEMLNAFSWLENDDFVREIVIDNTNKILDLCDYIDPFVDGIKPPRINDAIKKAKECNIIEEPFINCDDVIDANEYLRRLVNYNLEQRYGKNPDKFITDRVNTELNAIIGNGYGVIYYACHLMVKRSNDDGYIVGSRGSVGSSFVATLADITEVNPLPPHYICPKCHHFSWINDAASGYDAKDIKCPNCSNIIKGDGQNIPFETFLGFKGDKVPDIDLNFSNEYQARSHLFTREVFGEKNVYRAGTISKVAEKTAFGYVKGYCEEKNILNMTRAQRQRLASGCEDVKRTTGQHAGGVVVLPDDMEIEDVTPIQHPANDTDATWLSTHFEYHDFSEELLKFDNLGHIDPTAMKMFTDLSGIDVRTIPMNDEKVLSLFYSTKALNIINPNYHEITGAAGLPEFGTLNTRSTVVQTKPSVFSELVQISGLSHGTDVWRGNAQELIRKGIKLKDVIGCRDDIMSRLMSYGLSSSEAFAIMEFVRKNKAGKKLPEDMEKAMSDHNVPEWYIESCRKIKYMFPKAHAVAYCIMAVRVAWFKVYYPELYYVSFFSLRCDAYEIETMIKDADLIYQRMQELLEKIQSRTEPVKPKDKGIFDCLEMCYEMVSRGYKMLNIDLYKSDATRFKVNPDNKHEIIPPFIVLDGLGGNVAESIVKARKERNFISKEDLMNRTQLSQTLCKKLDALGVLKGLDDTNQMTLF